MNRIKVLLSIAVLFVGMSNLQAEDLLSPYYNLGTFKGDMNQAKDKVTADLEAAGFEILGYYHIENKNSLAVLVYTHNTIKSTVIKVKDRGALASALKIGFRQMSNGIEISMLNPEYLFNAYLMDNYPKYEAGLKSISELAKKTMNVYSGTMSPFGGKLEIDDIREYQYMFGMEEFTDPVELGEFASFEEALETIQKNLNSHKNGTAKVYEVIYPKENVAVIGIAWYDLEDGEPFYLPIIGEAHLAALPYELIIQGNEVTMLHGRYRIALHWPELTMGTFTKIISTPGGIEDAFTSLCKK